MLSWPTATSLHLTDTITGTEGDRPLDTLKIDLILTTGE